MSRNFGSALTSRVRIIVQNFDQAVTIDVCAAQHYCHAVVFLGGTSQDSLEVRTQRGGRVTLRAEAFAAGLKALSDLAPDDPQGWVRTSDETLLLVLQSENREKACASYVLPLLEAAGLIEIERKRPSRARVLPAPSPE